VAAEAVRLIPAWEAPTLLGLIRTLMGGDRDTIGVLADFLGEAGDPRQEQVRGMKLNRLQMVDAVTSLRSRVTGTDHQFLLVNHYRIGMGWRRGDVVSRADVLNTGGAALLSRLVQLQAVQPLTTYLVHPEGTFRGPTWHPSRRERSGEPIPDDQLGHPLSGMYLRDYFRGRAHVERLVDKAVAAGDVPADVGTAWAAGVRSFMAFLFPDLAGTILAF
jgi:hypothetical protein